jgi:hypothetical protein
MLGTEHHRLLEQHVQPLLEGGSGCLEVEGVRNRDHDRVELDSGE